MTGVLTYVVAGIAAAFFQVVGIIIIPTYDVGFPEFGRSSSQEWAEAASAVLIFFGILTAIHAIVYGAVWALLRFLLRRTLGDPRGAGLWVLGLATFLAMLAGASAFNGWEIARGLDVSPVSIASNQFLRSLPATILAGLAWGGVFWLASDRAPVLREETT